MKTKRAVFKQAINGRQDEAKEIVNIFKAESEMTGAVEGWLFSRGMTVKREFVSPWGICDLVALLPNKRHVRKRLGFDQRRPIRSTSRINLLDCIPDHESGDSTTLGRLRRVRQLAFHCDTLKADLERLFSDGYLVSPKPHHFQKLNGWMPYQRQLIAVELKLSRVPEALSQAANNLRFASESYVALPIELAQRVFKSNRLAPFRNTGVGIIGVTPDECRMLLRSKPANNDVDSVLQMYMAERFWPDILKAVEH